MFFRPEPLNTSYYDMFLPDRLEKHEAMSTIDERHERASAGVALNADTDGWYGDFARPRVFLQPIAAPSVLGLFGFAGATFIVASHMAGWYGNASTPGYLFPFAAFFGGLAQFTRRHVGVPRPRRGRDGDARHVGLVLACLRAPAAARRHRRAARRAARSITRSASGSSPSARSPFSGMLGALAEGNLGVDGGPRRARRGLRTRGGRVPARRAPGARTRPAGCSSSRRRSRGTSAPG